MEFKPQALSPHATTKYGRRGKVHWGTLRHRQAMNKIRYEEAKLLPTRTRIDVEAAIAALQAPTRRDVPTAAPARSELQKVTLFS